LFKPETPPPQHTGNEGFLNDGTFIKTHRSSHACFPAYPFDVPTIANWTQATGTNPADYTHWKPGDFAGWCHSSVGPIAWAQRSTNRVLDWLGLNRQTPFGRAARRLVEAPFGAYVSVENLVVAFTLPPGEKKLIAITCAISRINAILWLMVMTLVLLGLYLACCWPCFNIITITLHFCCCCGIFRKSDEGPVSLTSLMGGRGGRGGRKRRQPPVGARHRAHLVDTERIRVRPLLAEATATAAPELAPNTTAVLENAEDSD